HDDTTITSNGACIVALGRGPARFKTRAGRPVYATAVFFLNHSDLYEPSAVRVAISGLRIIVPAAKRMAGLTIQSDEVTLDQVTVAGAPTTDVIVGAGSPGAASMIEHVTIRESTLSGAQGDV